jgi:hypothetical protein
MQVMIRALIKVLVFTSMSIAFLQFFAPTSVLDKFQIVEAALFLLAGLIAFVLAYIKNGLHLLVSVPVVILILVASVFSFVSGEPLSAAFGFAICACILAARCILDEIGIKGLLDSYLALSYIAPWILLATTQSTLRGSLTGAQRIEVFSFHVNLLGAFLTTFITMQLYGFLKTRSISNRLVRTPLRVFILLSIATSLTYLWATKSRGSMGSLVGGVLVAQLLVKGRDFVTQIRAKRSTVIWVSALIATFCFTLIFSGTQQSRLDALAESSSRALDLNSKGRGLESGFSGRTNTWHEVMSTMDSTDWISGRGFRTYDKAFPSRRNTMDNGYLLSIFEVGVPITLYILFLYIRALWRSLKIARQIPQFAVLAIPIITFILAILANSVLENHFFGMGTSFGLFALALLSLRERDFMQGLSADSPLWKSIAYPLDGALHNSTHVIRDARALS